MIKIRASHPEWDSYIYSTLWDEDSFQKRDFYPFCFPVGFSRYPKDEDWELDLYTEFNDCEGEMIFYGDEVIDTQTKRKYKVDKVIVAHWIIDSDKMNQPMRWIKLVE